MSTPLRNRRPLLVAVGVGEIAIGCVVLFMAAMTLAEAAASVRFPSVGVPSSLIRTGLGLLTLATLCLTIGVGSVRCSNWTRILAMVLSAAWVGLTATLDVFVIAHILRHGLAPSTAPASSFLDDALAAFVWALPAVFFYFYSRPSVKATCRGFL
jgi:hypothetical protein